MSATMLHPVLAELEQRAGASDADRPAWLADRRNGVTATEIRDLYLRKISIGQLVAQKLGRVAEQGDLSHVPVIGWGKVRESVLAAEAEQRWGIRPESRVFRAVDNPRFLASPDGVGLDFDEQLIISELKTSGHDVTVGTAKYAEMGYRIQKTWGMRVTGARRCLYGWEERIATPDGFAAGERTWAWIDYDEKLAGELNALGTAFLSALDAAAAEDWSQPDVDEELDLHAFNYLRFLDEEKIATAAKKTAWEALQASLSSRTDEFRQESALARITYKPATAGSSTVLDPEAAKTADPTLFAEVQALSKRWNEHAAKFTKTVPATTSATLRVTPVKPSTKKGAAS